MQTELDLRDKEAGEGTDALKQQVKAANRSRRSYKDFLRRFCVMREMCIRDSNTANGHGSAFRYCDRGIFQCQIFHLTAAYAEQTGTAVVNLSLIHI